MICFPGREAPAPNGTGFVVSSLPAGRTASACSLPSLDARKPLLRCGNNIREIWRLPAQIQACHDISAAGQVSASNPQRVRPAFRDSVLTGERGLLRPRLLWSNQGKFCERPSPPNGPLRNTRMAANCLFDLESSCTIYRWATIPLTCGCWQWRP
jgi:hypothetical protein